MSTITWAALVLAVLATLLAMTLSGLGIRALTRERDIRWSYWRTYWVRVVSYAAWGLLGLIHGIVDHEWTEAAPILVGAGAMAVILGRRPKARAQALQR